MTVSRSVGKQRRILRRQFYGLKGWRREMPPLLLKKAAGVKKKAAGVKAPHSTDSSLRASYLVKCGALTPSQSF